MKEENANGRLAGVEIHSRKRIFEDHTSEEYKGLIEWCIKNNVNLEMDFGTDSYRKEWE